MVGQWLMIGVFVLDLSLAVPTVNSLSFLFTLLTGKLLGEDFGGKSKSDFCIMISESYRYQHIYIYIYIYSSCLNSDTSSRNAP